MSRSYHETSGQSGQRPYWCYHQVQERKHKMSATAWHRQGATRRSDRNVIVENFYEELKAMAACCGEVNLPLA